VGWGVEGGGAGMERSSVEGAVRVGGWVLPIPRVPRFPRGIPPPVNPPSGQIQPVPRCFTVLPPPPHLHQHARSLQLSRRSPPQRAQRVPQPHHHPRHAAAHEGCHRRIISVAVPALKV
jgi:hypothetical protein